MAARTVGLFLLMLVLWRCGPERVYEEEKTLSGNAWAYHDTLDFKFSIRDTAALYNLYARFAYADTFPAQNIYLRLHTVFPDGKRAVKQRSYDLFDAEGKSVGKCAGHACTAQLLLQDNAYFNLPGEYHIMLEQFTRVSPLPGLSAAGLVVEKTGKKR